MRKLLAGVCVFVIAMEATSFILYGILGITINVQSLTLLAAAVMAFMAQALWAKGKAAAEEGRTTVQLVYRVTAWMFGGLAVTAFLSWVWSIWTTVRLIIGMAVDALLPW